MSNVEVLRQRLSKVDAELAAARKSVEATEQERSDALAAERGGDSEAGKRAGRLAQAISAAVSRFAGLRRVYRQTEQQIAAIEEAERAAAFERAVQATEQLMQRRRAALNAADLQVEELARWLVEAERLANEIHRMSPVYIDRPFVGMLPLRVQDALLALLQAAGAIPDRRFLKTTPPALAAVGEESHAMIRKKFNPPPPEPEPVLATEEQAA